MAYRAGLLTGQLEIAETDYAGWTGDQPGRTRYKTIRFAGDRSVIIDRGDEEGIVLRTTEGTPVTNLDAGTSPYFQFEAPGEVWNRSENPLSLVRVRERAPGLCADIRTLGAAPLPASFDIHDLIWRDNVRNPAARKCEESVQDGLHVVRVHGSLGTTTYWLDPARGWSPVRVRNDSPDGSWAEARCALERLDGVWFPVAVESYLSRFADGRQPARVVQVQAATFNRPEHAPELTIADIGVETGMVMVRTDAGGQESSGRWDGTRQVPEEEFERRRLAGELEPSPNFVRALAAEAQRQAQERAGVGSEADVPLWLTPPAAVEAARHPVGAGLSLWEDYVRKFIEKYRLDAAQQQQAVRALRSCQHQAHAYLRRKKADFERLDRLDAAAGANSTTAGPDRGPASPELRRLLIPIDDIFNKQLKPRLDMIPTRRQRLAVDQGGATNAGRQPDTRPAAGLPHP